MTLARLAPLLLTGCIIHTDEDLFGGSNNKSIDEANLWVEPSQVDAPSTVTITITDDDWPSYNFQDVYNVRALGDFDVLEWSVTEDRISAVVDVLGGAQGEQPIGIDSSTGTVYASFDAY